MGSMPIYRLRLLAGKQDNLFIKVAETSGAAYLILPEKGTNQIEGVHLSVPVSTLIKGYLVEFKMYYVGLFFLRPKLGWKA